MLVGILADTHDNLRAVRYFVEFFRHREADVLIHAGDLISPFVVPELDEFPGPVHGVFGNNDGDRETIREFTRDTSVNFSEAPHRVDLEDTTLLVAHKPGDLPESPPEDVDVLIHGHTHERRHESGTPLLLNPGEAGGWISETASAALLDTATSSVDFELVPQP